MEKDQILGLGIGTEESTKLEAKPCKVVSLDITQKEWSGKPSDQLVVMVKHPDKAEPFQLYNVAYQKGSSIKTVGFTLYYDSKGELMQGTAPAEVLKVYNLRCLKDLVGKDINTILSAKGFLALKAY